MGSPFRNLKKGFRRLIRARQVTVDGILLCTDPAKVSRQVRNGIYKECYEEPERQLLRGFLQKGDKVLEVGGGVGFVSLVCAKICGPENVLIYEANPGLAPLIEENFRLNGLRPNLRSKAITNGAKEVTFFCNDNIVSSSLYDRSGSVARTVPADPLDSVLNEWQPTTLIMDAEGAEVDILGASKIAGVRKLVLELHPHIVGEAAIQKLTDHLAAIGFKEHERVGRRASFLRETVDVHKFGQSA